MAGGAPQIDEARFHRAAWKALVPVALVAVLSLLGLAAFAWHEGRLLFATACVGGAMVELLIAHHALRKAADD